MERARASDAPHAYAAHSRLRRFAAAALETSSHTRSAVRAEALKAVTIPESILGNLVELREYLAERCEPPVYVSDRRMLKAANLLKVSAYTCGRTEVNSFDTLLLEHVLWTVPEDAAKKAWLAKLDAPSWGKTADALDTVLAQDCVAGVEVACDALSLEQEAKKVLARAHAFICGSTRHG